MIDTAGAEEPPRVRLQGPGSHTAYYDDGGRLVVEWYDFGDHAPYESANMLYFDPEQQGRLAVLLGSTTSAVDRAGLLALIKRRFSTYFEVKEFATAQKLPFETKVDFWP